MHSVIQKMVCGMFFMSLGHQINNICEMFRHLCECDITLEGASGSLPLELAPEQ